jgi:Tfp pilus assembly protein PilE
MRFTLRGMMIAVAVIAVLTWIAQAASRWSYYRTRAEHHAAELRNLNADLVPALEFRREMGYFPGCALGQTLFERVWDEAEWHARLKSKYELAATRPWRSVEPDPPPPE